MRSEHDDRALGRLRGDVEVTLECAGVRGHVHRDDERLLPRRRRARVPPRSGTAGPNGWLRRDQERGRDRSGADARRGRWRGRSRGDDPRAGQWRSARRAVRRVSADRQRRRPLAARPAGARGGRRRARRGHAPLPRSRPTHGHAGRRPGRQLSRSQRGRARGRRARTARAGCSDRVGERRGHAAVE